MRLVTKTIQEVDAFRYEYLKGLPEFQELFLELMIPSSNIYLLVDDQSRVGYVIISNEQVLIEFYLMDPYVSKSLTCFNLIIQELAVKKVLCKSFDKMLLQCCQANKFTSEVEGMLYREYQTPVNTVSDAIGMRQIGEAAIPEIMSHQDCFDELFETIVYLRYFINNDRVFLFYKDDQVVGCGTLIKTHPKYNFCDLGVWVHSAFRKQGIGTHILSTLREVALADQFAPSCGCGIDNIASQRTIEKSGFIHTHVLIEYTV